jgi:3'(2'),5'-bisphosphate nucleotidase
MNTPLSGIQMIGIQRSGSNLLRVILDQSGQIAAPHPPHLLSLFIPLMPLYQPLDAGNYRLLIADVTAYIQANPVPWEHVRFDNGELFRRSERFHLFELFRLVYEEAALAKGASCWCCKSMANVYFAGEMEAFGIRPKYIYLYRDGRDVAASFKKAIVGEKHIYHLATQWKEDQRHCLELRKHIEPSRFFSLSYETLISEPEQTVRSLCSFLGISYEEKMLQFYDSAASRSTAAAGEMWSNVEKPIIRSNTKKFLTGFSKEELELFELIAHDELSQLGYPLYTSPQNKQLLSPEAIQDYEAVNRQLKKEILLTARQSDLDKREKQAGMLAAIKGRLPRVPIESLKEIALQAGKAILDIYDQPEAGGRFTIKADASPLTLADQASHEIIVRGLHALTPGIPVISEEGADVPYEVRRHWAYYWCIDPLDGTKEFLHRNGEFTINIALVHNQRPVFGIIYVPVSQAFYYGSEETGSWKITQGQAPVRLQTDDQAPEWTSVVSRSHAGSGETELLSRYPVTRQIAAGSALKFCMIAEGRAHIYYRHGPTMEWDTAAGHAIVQYSGGKLSQPSGEPFLYNKESLLNGSFICSINHTK